MRYPSHRSGGPAIGGLIAVAVVFYLIFRMNGAGVMNQPGGPAATPAPATAPTGGSIGRGSAGEQILVDAFDKQRSGVMVTVEGRVTKTLPDDDDGDRHQRFIIELPASGHTVLVAHNIDLAPRAPLDEGDAVTVHGQYEYNEQGGVLHWTHHDPRGRRSGGWIEVDGERFE